MPDVGDLVTARLTVSPADATTQAALVVTLPDGSILTPVVTGTDNGAVWTAPVVYTMAGVWRLSWTVTGTGASVEHELVSVAPTPGVTTTRSYATTTDLANYLRAAPPVDAAHLLEGASRMLDARVLQYCRYDVTTDGLPSDAAVAAAIGRAVCAQVAWWGEVGDSVGAAGAGYGSVSIGSVSLGGSTSTSTDGAGSAARQIAPQVWDELRSPALHGLLVLGAVAVSW
ncbi:hypothetical protein ACIQTN_25760 [Streptomyces werraensis]|uniref:hypothetical protein n=1 Tax=Streptomyces werraensis TaxID=68284 RepID=UPI0038209DEA